MMRGLYSCRGGGSEYVGAGVEVGLLRPAARGEVEGLDVAVLAARACELVRPQGKGPARTARFAACRRVVGGDHPVVARPPDDNRHLADVEVVTVDPQSR